jgi:serine/threonine-protein kinase
MPIDRVDTLLQALEESQLLSAAQLAECRDGLTSFADTRALARHLLQRDWLTPYQVNYILQGKAGELFLDNYVLMERIGQGGMGQVFRAKHRIMERVVALKIIRHERLANPEMVKRFRREIKLAAQLTHPNIVAAYDADEVNGMHFLVMEFVEGIDLARHVEKNGRRPVPQACDWVRQVALGLQHAHERGMVHRDIKPANLLLAVKENVVKVLDMGLARLSHAADAEQTAAGLTQEGTVMGTPDYMAPEQAEESTAVDIRADIYSLGCTLYFLLAGQAPFVGGTLAQKLRKHAMAEPEPLAARRDDVPAGLVAVVRKMMAKRPEDRYQTPGEVAAALEVFCRVGPVAAVPVAVAVPARPVAVPLTPEGHADVTTALPGAEVVPAAETVPPSVLDSVASVTLKQEPLARARGAWRRLGRRGQLIAAGAAAVLLILLLVVLVRRPGRQDKQVEQEQSVLDRLDKGKILAEDQPFLKAKGLDDLVVAVLGEHRIRVPNFVGMALSPDRKTVAVVDGAVIRLVDTKTLHEVRELAKHTNTVLSLSYSADGKYLASGGADNTALVWNVASGDTAGAPIQRSAAVRAVALTPKGDRLLVAEDGSNQIATWDVASGQRGKIYTGHKAPVQAVIVSPDGQLAYSAGGPVPVGKEADKDVHVWNVASAEPDRAGDNPRRLTGHKGYVTRFEFSPNGKRLLAATDQAEVPIWSVADRSDQIHPLVVPNVPNAPANGTFVGDEQAVMFCNGKFWPFIPDSHEGYSNLDPIPVTPGAGAVAWLREVPREARGGEMANGILYVADGTLRVWNLVRKVEWRPPLGHTQPARWLTFLGDRLVSAGDDRTVRFWDLANLYDPATGWPREGRPTLTALQETNRTLLGAPISADGNLALTLTSNNAPFVNVWIWENDKWNQVRELRWKDAPNGQFLTGVGLSPDGSRALTSGTDKLLRLWDVKRPTEPLKTIDGLPNSCSVVRLLSGSQAYTWDGAELRLWDGIDGGNRQFVAIPTPGATAVAVAAGREIAVVGENDGHLERLTDLARGKQPPQVFDWYHRGAITALALSPKMDRLLAGSPESTKKLGPCFGLWDLTRETLDKPRMWSLRGAPTALAFAPDGRHAALANPDGTIYILRLPR